MMLEPRCKKEELVKTGYHTHGYSCGYYYTREEVQELVNEVQRQTLKKLEAELIKDIQENWPR